MALTYFSQAPLRRDQTQLFYPTLEDSISEDHPVRVLDELLNSCDFSEWEQHYHGSRGQPPHPPRTLAKVLLYALSRSIRSSRLIEYAMGHNMDFMWLAEGRIFDHSTLCEFRTRFGPELKALFRQLGKLALTLGLVRLNQITFDGTRVRANNSRMGTLTAAGIEERLKELDQQLTDYLQESAAADRADQEHLPGPSDSIPPQLADLNARQEALKQALATVQAMDEERRKNQGINPAKNPAQLPETDGDSRVMQSKEGGYAPNYTPLAAVDVDGDFIVAVSVINAPTEHTETLATVEQVAEDFGQRPEQALADCHHATGQNIAAFENSGTELISPLPTTPRKSDVLNPALRPDPTQPVPEEQWDKLPRNSQYKKLDKSCFVYDAENDLYRCPQGQALPFEETKSAPLASGHVVKFRAYRCATCSSCPLREQCVSPKSKDGRTIRRDEFTEQRERHAAKMATPEAKAAYKKRLHSGEVIFAHIKQVMGLRQFLLRGLDKVNLEWLWTCTSYNVYKLVRFLMGLRNQSALDASAEPA
jgi:transposase